MSPRCTKDETFKTRDAARKYLERRGMRVVTRRSVSPTDRALANRIPKTAHWGFVGTKDTSDRGVIGQLIGLASWDKGVGLHVTMLDGGELPPKGRQGRRPKSRWTKFTIRLRTDTELARFRERVLPLFTEFAVNRSGGQWTVDGVTYTSNTS